MKSIASPTLQTATRVKLNDTILSVLDDYITIILSPYVKLIHDNFVNSNAEEASLVFLQQLPSTDCSVFESEVKNFLKSESVTALALIYLNKILVSKDLEILKTNDEIYRDVLEGKLCNKPMNNQEGIDVVHSIQEVLVEHYTKIVDSIAQTSVDTLGSNSTAPDL